MSMLTNYSPFIWSIGDFVDFLKRRMVTFHGFKYLKLNGILNQGNKWRNFLKMFFHPKWTALYPPPPSTVATGPGMGNYDHSWRIQGGGGVDAPPWEFEAEKRSINCIILCTPFSSNSKKIVLFLFLSKYQKK